MTPISAPRPAPSGLARGVGHRVRGTALPPGDAGVHVFRCGSQISWDYEAGLPTSQLDDVRYLWHLRQHGPMGIRRYFETVYSSNANSRRQKSFCNHFHARHRIFF